MATYASTSNPFIKQNDISPIRKVGKKDAPGMAKPQNLLIKQQQQQQLESNSLMNISYDCSSMTKSSSSTSISDDKNIQTTSELMSLCCDVEKNSCKDIVDNNKIISPSLSSENGDDSFEITKACESLVEMTVRLELEERNKIDELKKKVLENENNIVTDTNDTSRTVENNDVTSPTNKIPKELEEVVEEEDDDDDDEVEIDLESPPMERNERQQQHIELIKKLRLQLRDLEKYAYERGELDQVPQSVIAERQSVILDTLKERLSLNISRGEIERLELDELKKQVDKEIHDLIDPLMTKEHLLTQLKTQLTDLERYISHLHGTIGKIHDKRDCSCKIHGCSSSMLETFDENNKEKDESTTNFISSTTTSNEALPKTTKLIRSLVTQLICSDIKLRESVKKERKFEMALDKNNNNFDLNNENKNYHTNEFQQKDIITNGGHVAKVPQINDGAAWSLHIDRVILATDSLVNLFTLKSQNQRSALDRSTDDGLVESIVRRQLVPAIKDLLSYGIIDQNLIPKSNSYVSLLFDPYYILSSLTCFPTSQKSNNLSSSNCNTTNQIHIWNIIEDYYNSKNEPRFKSSSAKTLSQSFNLAPSISGPIKITSKQALLIAVEDIIETLSRCKPNGPDSHFRRFIYIALNRNKLPTWLRLIFKNKSVNRKYYHTFSFTSQVDKMDKFLTILDALNQFEFKLRTDVDSIEQFVSAF